MAHLTWREARSLADRVAAIWGTSGSGYQFEERVGTFIVQNRCRSLLALHVGEAQREADRKNPV